MQDPGPSRPPAPVAQVFAGYAPEVRAPLMQMRALILEIAAEDQRVGPLTETLKWGEPAYLTERTGSGSTLRLGVSKGNGRGALFLNCRTGLVGEIRALYGDRLDCVADREVRLPDDLAPLQDPLRHAATLALTYHLRRR